MTIQLEAGDRLKDILNRLIAMSKADYYNPYQLFEWPERLPDDQYWMSPELMSVHGTAAAADLSVDQLKAISKWESINFYSLNVDGIKDLIKEIISRIHTPEFAVSSEYFHHLIGEENEHMWFFATFCLNYGGKLYPDKGIDIPGPSDPASAHFLTFARLLIFEEIVDFYNKQMGTDERLHPTIRQVNAIHHQDESRHVAFGRQIVSLLHSQLRSSATQADLDALEAYLKRYIRMSVDSLVNPAAFRDAGVEDPYALRRAILGDPAFRALEAKMLKRTLSFMTSERIFSDATIPESS